MNKEIFRKKILYYLENFRRWTDWKPKQTKEGIDVCTRGDLSAIKFMTKVECKVNCDLQKAFEVAIQWHYSNESMYKTEVLEKSSIGDNQNNVDMYFYTKFPFPFTARDFLVSIWSQITPKYATVLMGSVERTDKPPIKGKIRGKIMSVLILEKDENDPSVTNMVIFGQSDYKVRMPNWIASNVWRAYYFLIFELRKLMES